MRQRQHHRASFTLIELLVVIAIIGFLLALSASAVLKYMQVQQNDVTRTTLNKLQGLLNRQWSAEKDKAWKESIPPAVYSYIQTHLASSDANAAARIRVIYVKLRMRQVFPMNFNEALKPYPLPPLPAYVSTLTSLGVTGSTGGNYESAVCLYLALSRESSGGGGSALNVGGGGTSAAFTLPTGHGITGYADAFGQPIHFTRYSAGNRVLNTIAPWPLGGQPGIKNDPGDPNGLLGTLGWGQSPQSALFSTLTLQPLAKPTCSYNLQPMVASGGADKKISDPLYFSATQTIDNDNLYSTP